MNRRRTPAAIDIDSKIHVIRGLRVIFDRDISEMYGVETRSLIQAVKRNLRKFPEDFAFQLSKQELKDWRSQIVTSNPEAKMSLRRQPYAFTEHGAVMAATILNSQIAVEMSILIVRAFIHTRKLMLEHTELRKRLGQLENKIYHRFKNHEEELREIRFTIQQLILPHEQQTKKKPIGFRRKQQKD